MFILWMVAPRDGCKQVSQPTNKHRQEVLLSSVRLLGYKDVTRSLAFSKIFIELTKLPFIHEALYLQAKLLSKRFPADIFDLIEICFFTAFKQIIITCF